MTREAGKGDAPRKGADQEAYASGWDRIFKKNKESELHACPCREELFDDHHTMCDCSDEETRNCAEDI